MNALMALSESAAAPRGYARPVSYTHLDVYKRQLLEQLVSTMELLRQVLAERTGRQPDDLALRTLAGAVMGVTMAVMVALDDDPTANIGVLLDEALAHLEAGLTL